MGLILDSSIVIDAERQGDPVRDLIRRVVSTTGDQESVLSSVGLTELVHGLYRTQDTGLRQRREAYLTDLLRSVIVYPFTQATAMLAGKIHGEQRSHGITIPSLDLLIGATALEIEYSLLTVNVRHFRLIPGLTVVTL
jgi:predicted nucleic acid-binding protein